MDASLYLVKSGHYHQISAANDYLAASQLAVQIMLLLLLLLLLLLSSVALISLQTNLKTMCDATICCRSFINALLPHLTKLPASSNATEDAAEGKLSLLQLLARLLSLDAERVLDTSQPSFEFVFSSYCGCFMAR